MPICLSFNARLSENYEDIFDDIHDLEAKVHPKDCDCCEGQHTIDECPHIKANAKLK